MTPASPGGGILPEGASYPTLGYPTYDLYKASSLRVISKKKLWLNLNFLSWRLRLSTSSHKQCVAIKTLDYSAHCVIKEVQIWVRLLGV